MGGISTVKYPVSLTLPNDILYYANGTIKHNITNKNMISKCTSLASFSSFL